MSVVSRRYAEALFDLAKEKNRVSKYRKDIELMSDSLVDVSNAHNFLIYERISKNNKKKLIRRAFKNSVSKDVLNFVYLLIDKGYIVEYKSIFKDFHELCNEELKIEEGYVYSKRPLSDNDLRKISKKLSEGVNKVILQNKIDEEIISGFKVVLKDKVIDYSMKNKIDDLKNHLLKEGA